MSFIFNLFFRFQCVFLARFIVIWHILKNPFDLFYILGPEFPGRGPRMSKMWKEYMKVNWIHLNVFQHISTYVNSSLGTLPPSPSQSQPAVLSIFPPPQVPTRVCHSMVVLEIIIMYPDKILQIWSLQPNWLSKQGPTPNSTPGAGLNLQTSLALIWIH